MVCKDRKKIQIVAQLAVKVTITVEIALNYLVLNIFFGMWRNLAQDNLPSIN